MAKKSSRRAGRRVAKKRSSPRGPARPPRVKPSRARPASGEPPKRASTRSAAARASSGAFAFTGGLLSPEAVRDIKLSCKASSWASPPAVPSPRARTLGYDDTGEPTHRPIIVAEGDSWFDYPPGVDILNWMHVDHGYSVQQFSHYGDTLENMIYGEPAAPTRPTDFLIRTIEHHHPRAFLFSGGGNDVAGPELRPFLNHAQSGLPPLRLDYAEQVFNENVRRAYEHLLDAFQGANITTPVLAHGYAYPVPDGRSVNLLIWRIAGPWLRPYFDEKQWGRREASQTMRTLIDMFNEMLAGLESDYPGRFHHVDLRGEVRDADWVNELHVNDKCYRRIARRFEEAIQGAIN